MQIRFCLAGVFALALVFSAQPLLSQEAAAPTSPPAHAHPPLPKPVNLKVLPKNIAPEQLIRIMRGFTGSLGVECGFCHAENPQTHKLDFASDAKDEKATARLMISMTRDINEQFMSKVSDPDATAEDKRVSCGTCHRGHSMPEHFVPPPEKHRPAPAQQHPQ